jgi:hypothetical protein
MKQYEPLAKILASRELLLEEFYKPVWTGGLTTEVTYRVSDREGYIVARESFHWNRHIAFYRELGLRARKNSERYNALVRLLAKIN